MPWRTKTLTQFRSPPEEDAETDFGFEHVGGPSLQTGDNLDLFGGDGECDNFDMDGTAIAFDVVQNEITGSSNPSRGRSKSRASAIDLGASQISRGPVLDDENFCQMLHDSFLKTAEPMSVLMPWEKGVAKRIFSKGQNDPAVPKQQMKGWVRTDGILPAETIEPGSTMVEAPSVKLSGAIFERALSAVSDKHFLEKRLESLESAIDKWFSIIRINLLGSDVGLQIIGHGGTIHEQKLGAYETIEAIIGVRSRTTAISRANALLKFFRWRADFTEDDGRPVSEEAAWKYVSWLRSEGAAATRASSFLAACGYALHVFGFRDFEKVYNSRRVKGLAEIMHSNKHHLKQAKVLSVSQVVALHNLLGDSTANFIDRALAAYAILALYGRCRHSDLAFVECVMLDFDDQGGFVEVSTRAHKTAKTASQKSQLLPIVVPAIGVTGHVWVQEAVDAFASCGLSLDGEIHGPLFRPPMASGGGLCKRGLTSSEVTKFLRLLFESDEGANGDARISSHSLKATALSWASKFGLAIQDKAILGRHSSATTEAHAIYSRDLAVASVMKLQDVIMQIARFEFQPDNPRRGYFQEGTHQPDQLPAEVVKVEEDSPTQDEAHGSEVLGGDAVDEHQSSSSESSSEESSGPEEEIRPPPPKCYRHTAMGQMVGRFVIHKTTKLVHYKDTVVGRLKDDGKCVLSCGRALNQNYDAVVNFETVALCRRCKVNAVKDGLLPQG